MVVLPSVLDMRLERCSKSLFGNRHMLRVGQNVAKQRAPFTVTDVSSRTGVPYSSAHRLIRQLEDVGLLRRVTTTLPADPHHRFERVPHRFWGAVQDLCKPVVDSSIRAESEVADA